MRARLLLVGLVAVVAVLSSLSLFANAETVRWRYPGFSGRWLDPHNWIGVSSGLPKVPGPNDDVVLSDWSYVYGSTYTVTLEARNTPVTVKSLTVDQGTCSPCTGGVKVIGAPSGQVRYLYNSAVSMWQNVTVDSDSLGYCGVALEVIAPTQLIVTGALTLSARGQLRMISLANKIDLKCSITAGTWSLNGRVYGIGDFKGSVVLRANMDLIRLFPKGVIPATSSQKAGTITVYGNFDSTSGKLGFFIDYSVGLYSILDVQGTLAIASTNYIYAEQSYVTNASYPIITFLTTTTTNPSWYNIGTFSGVASMKQQCPSGLYESNSINGVGLPGACTQTSSHDFSALLSTSGDSCCPAGYTGSDCSTAVCPGYPPCSGRGSCNAPACLCNDGWQGFACELPECPGTPLECSGNGICFAPTPLGSAKPYCKCRTGWGGPDCGTPLCPNNCTDATHGTCNTQGNSPKCICNAGYQLGPNLDCAYPIPTCPGQTQECSGHGTCVNSTCQCDSGWDGADCSLAICPNACNHRGVCVSDGGTGTMCQCNSGWSGADCSTPACNNGAGCSGHGYCSPDLDPPRCICNGPTVLPASPPPSPAVNADKGWAGSDCSVGFLPSCSDTNCVANGGKCGNSSTGLSCLMNTCPPGFTGWDCSEYVCDNTGYPECSGHGNCRLISGAPQCICRPGYDLGYDNSCQYATCEIYGCSGHGTCRTDLAVPACECDPYFYGADCSLATCPGYPLVCNGQGTCNLDGTCTCNSEWQASDCSVPVCPSTNGINCNDNGYCNTTSSPFFCDCFEGWKGSSCEKANCPNDCSGHGYCDTTLAPPACRCDPFYLGDDCHSASSTGTTDTQDTMMTVLYALMASGIGLLFLMVVLVVIVYFVWTKIGRKKMRDSVKRLSVANYAAEDEAL